MNVEDDLAVLAFAAQRPSALATVVSALGSAPRGLGSHMAVRADGLFAGSVSGGCVEAAVIAEARDLLAGGPPRRLDYGVADETAWSVGLACGGNISILLTAAPPEPLRLVTEAVAAGRSAALMLDATGLVEAVADGHDCGLDGETRTRIHAMAEADASGPLADGRFVRAYGPPWRLVLVGAVHIAQTLAPMARAAGFGVVVIDSRRAFADPARFPDIDLRHGWPDEVLPSLRLDRRTALVTLAHDPRIDDPALAAALATGCFHVGALGSRRTHAARLERLGPGAERISGPVGLDIGASHPAEIAVAILAETILARRGGKWS